MRIGSTVLDLEILSEEDLSLVIREAQNIRTRKNQANAIKSNLDALGKTCAENSFDICNKYTGEVFDPNDWLIYDNELHIPVAGEWDRS